MEQLEADLRDHLIAATQDKDYSEDELYGMALSFVKKLVAYGDDAQAQTDEKPQGSDGAKSNLEDLGVDPSGGWDDTPASGAEQYKLPKDLVRSKGGWDDTSPAGTNWRLAGKPLEYAPHGAPVATQGGWDDDAPNGTKIPPSFGIIHPEAGWGDGDSRNSRGTADDSVHPNLTLDEFNKFAGLARAQEYRPKLAAGKTQELSPDERSALVETQKRLGVKQTGRYDNTTRHALQVAFIDLIRPVAEAEEKRTGIPAAVTIGQAILESGYGIHIPRDIKTGQVSNNFFGIKPDKRGQAFVTSWTKEYNDDGELESKLQPFAVYDNMNGSIQEHSAFLKRNSGRYGALFSTSDPMKWAQGLQDAGYGGKKNKTYAGALIGAMRMWNLIK